MVEEVRADDVVVASVGVGVGVGVSVSGVVVGVVGGEDVVVGDVVGEAVGVSTLVGEVASGEEEVVTGLVVGAADVEGESGVDDVVAGVAGVLALLLPGEYMYNSRRRPAPQYSSLSPAQRKSQSSWFSALTLPSRNSLPQ